MPPRQASPLQGCLPPKLPTRPSCRSQFRPKQPHPSPNPRPNPFPSQPHTPHPQTHPPPPSVQHHLEAVGVIPGLQCLVDSAPALQHKDEAPNGEGPSRGGQRHLKLGRHLCMCAERCKAPSSRLELWFVAGRRLTRAGQQPASGNCKVARTHALRKLSRLTCICSTQPARI